MNVHCTIGVKGSGKTHAVNELRAQKPDQFVCLQPGRFFRDTLGEGIFASHVGSAHPATEGWVRELVQKAVIVAKEMGRDLILDGFPRSLAQFVWLNSLLEMVAPAATKVLEVVWAPEGVLDDRLVKRDGSQALALATRQADRDAVITIVNAARTSQVVGWAVVETENT